MALFMDKNLEYARQKLQFNKNSKILVINTEGDTDPVNFKKIIDKGPL
jgi:diaminopropionate ammonia-lyase